jgi:hypothetical protein
LSFRPPARIARDEEFDERLFDQAGLSSPAGNAEPADQDLDAEEEPPPAREGLPAGFRMRADAHYVDEVVSRRLADPILLIPLGEIDGPHPLDDDLQRLVRSVARFGILQPLLVRRRAGRYELISGVRRLAAAMAAGLTEVPCLVCSADDGKARELAEAANLLSQEQAPAPEAEPLPAEAFAELTEQLGSIEACLHLFGDRERPTRERVGMALIRTEVRRAAWLTQALAVLSSEAPVTGRTVDLQPLVRRVVSGMTAEQSVTGVGIEVTGLDSGIVQGDEQLLTIALGGMIEAVQAAAERCPGARVTTALRADANFMLVEVGLAGGELPSAVRKAFLDLHSQDRPGGARAAIGIMAASLVAERHGGALRATDAGGARLVLSLPAEER